MHAPKKIWVRELPATEDGHLIGLSYHREPVEEGVQHQYIRADIVEEMREALETMIEAYKGEFGSHWGEQCAEETEEHDEVIKARAALKWLEEP